MAKTNLIRYRRGSLDGGPGEVRMIYNEDIDPENFGNDVEIKRASHVDPGSELSQEALQYLEKHTGCVEVLDLNDHPIVIAEQFASKWFADCIPTNGPVLGPFDKRSEALAAEEVWVRENVI